MQKLTSIEAKQVSGGTLITLVGMTKWMDTSGIPEMCVRQITEAVDDVAQAFLYGSSAFLIADVHGAIIVNSGCDVYLDTYRERMDGVFF